MSMSAARTTLRNGWTSIQVLLRRGAALTAANRNGQAPWLCPSASRLGHTLGSTPNAGRLGMSDVEAKRNVHSFRDDVIGKTIPHHVVC